jgi:hypothetical protein
MRSACVHGLSLRRDDIAAAECIKWNRATICHQRAGNKWAKVALAGGRGAARALYKYRFPIIAAQSPQTPPEAAGRWRACMMEWPLDTSSNPHYRRLDHTLDNDWKEAGLWNTSVFGHFFLSSRNPLFRFFFFAWNPTWKNWNHLSALSGLIKIYES